MERMSLPPLSFLDLQSEYRELQSGIDAAVARVLDSSQFILGPEVQGSKRSSPHIARLRRHWR